MKMHVATTNVTRVLDNKKSTTDHGNAESKMSDFSFGMCVWNVAVYEAT